MENKTKQLKAVGLVSILAAVVMVLTACSGAKKNEINVKLSSYKIDMASTSAPAGDVTFHLEDTSNDTEHEFVVFKTDLDASQLPLDSEGNVDEAQLTSMGEEELQPLEKKDLTLNLQPGHYAIICNMDGHYGQGMYTNFTVQ